MAARSGADEDSAVRQALRGAGRVIRVGNYMIERRLGSGGQADVFLARDVILRRLVALKVLHRNAANPVRGVEEARLIATLDHPNILRVHHVEFSEGTWYMVTEYVDGGNLEVRVQRLGPLDPLRALRHAVAVADALQHAHQIGVLHRDLKPQNVLETRSGIVKLADFGLAGWQREMLESSGSRAAGTPQYLAPEIWSGAPASVRSDIYSLGATLFFMLTGQPPFPAQNMKEMRQAHQQAPVVFPFRQPAVIADAVKHCMAKNAADRPASARAVHDELSDALAHLTGDRRARRRRGGPTAAQESTVYSHASRMSAQAAMARLPVWAAARERLGQTLLSGSPLVVFSGAHPDAMARVLRGVVEHGTHKLFIAARCLVGAQRLGAACFEQLHLGTFPQPAWQDRVISELAPESGSTPAIPSVMELELRAQLTVAELNELLELGRRAEGKALVFLITAPPPVARTLLTHLQGTHHSFLVRHFELPEMGRLEAIDYVREWTRHATNEHMMWTDDGIRLLLHLVVTQARSLDLLMHNAIVVANHAHRRVLTTWAVAAADAHPLSLDSADGILPAWRNAPNTWPSAEMLATLKELRPQRAATAQ